MELLKLQRAVHGRSAMATYSFAGFKLNVYVRHNKPGKKEYGSFYLSAYVNPNNGNPSTEHSFDKYGDFRNFRSKLMLGEIL